MLSYRMQWLVFPLVAVCAVANAAPPDPNLRVRRLDCAGGPADVEIDVLDNTFEPNAADIESHSVVRFDNGGTVMHTVTSGAPEDAEPGSLFDYEIQPGESLCLGFDGTGTTTYFCRPHAALGMRDATINVTAPAMP